jgi:hypothetical protein
MDLLLMDRHSPDHQSELVVCLFQIYYLLIKICLKWLSNAQVMESGHHEVSVSTCSIKTG